MSIKKYKNSINKERTECYINNITKRKGETAYVRQYFYNNSYNGDFHGK